MTHISQAFPDLLNHFVFGGVGSPLSIKVEAACPSSSLPWDVLVQAKVHGAPLAPADRSTVFCRGAAGKLGEQQHQSPRPRVAHDSQSCSAFHITELSTGTSAQDAPGGAASLHLFFWGFLTAIGARAEVLLCSHLCKRWVFFFLCALCVILAY